MLGASTYCTAQQLIEVPLESNPIIIEYLKKNPISNARNSQTCPADTLGLPFFEDFSNAKYTDELVHPDCAKWQDNHVFINRDMAYNPPSVGVATFDGLAPNGQPYNQTATVGIGSPSDTLTSQHLDLSGKTAASNIYLSFFYQKQGLGDRPEVQDSFMLEFKDSSNVWRKVWSKEGVNNSFSSQALFDFNQQYIKIDSAYFLYDGFQFRFRNKASITGNNDHWHLDYVMLDSNRVNNADTLNLNYGKYNDVAFTHRPSTPLENGYTAMPWRHFNNSWADSVKVENYNHNTTVSGTGTLDRACWIDEISPNPNSLLVDGIPAVAAYQGSPNSDDSTTHTFINPIATFDPTEPTILESTYVIINPSGFQSNPIFYDNDTTRRKTVLDNYFAYDDGTAETRVIAQGLGTKIAVEFVAEVEDTLQGIYFHLPYFTSRDAQLDFVNVKVWLNNLHDSSEVFSRDLHHLQYRLGFNGFYFVDLVDFTNTKYLVPIEAGQKFYVGWQQSFGPEVPVGFDKSSDASSKTWIGTGATWTQATLKGAVMIRPLLSPDSNYTTIAISKIEQSVNQLKIYPNPTQDILNLELEDDTKAQDYTVSIYNTLGQEIYNRAFEKQISLNHCLAGIYVLTLRDEKGKIIAQQKIQVLSF